MTTAITLDELIALSDEIGALVRAGVPLEQGLAELGGDLPGRLGWVATTLAEQTSRGQPLAEAIARQTEQLPAAYRAVVQAGMRAGRLPAALETIAATARRISESQRAIVLAAAYPLLVFMIAWGALAYLTVMLAPRLEDDFSAFSAAGGRFYHFVAWLGHGAVYWGPAGPLCTLLLLGAWWYAVTRARALGAGRSHRLLCRLPWIGLMLRWSSTATFLEILGLLVENEVPLHEGVVLAADACGDADTVRSAAQLAALLQRGGRVVPPADPGGRDAFPPLIRWLMLAAGRDGALPSALRSSAAAYRCRAEHQADFIRVFLPVVLTVGIGGSVVAAYALTVFAPYAALLRFLGKG